LSLFVSKNEPSSEPQPHGPFSPLPVPVFMMESPTRNKAGCNAAGLVWTEDCADKENTTPATAVSEKARCK
jgi:hypothetical protein